MPPYVTTKFGRNALRNTRGGPPKRTGGGNRGGGNRGMPRSMGISDIIAAMYGEMLSPKAMRKQARADVNLAMKDSLGTLRADEQRQLERIYRERYANQQAQAAISSMSSGDPGAASGAWSAAGANSGALNTALSESVGASQQAALDTAGATTTALVPGYEGGAPMPGSAAANTAVNTYLGATLPGPTFGAKAAAAATSMDLTRAQAMAKFKDLAPGFENELMDIRDKYTMARNELLSKKPSALREAMAGVDEQRQNRYATILSALGLQNTMRATDADIQSAIAKVTMDQAELTETTRHHQATESDAAARAAIQRMNAQSTRMNANTSARRADIAEVAATGDAAKIETTTRDAMYDTANKLASATFNKKRGRSKLPPPSREALARKIQAMYGPPLYGKNGITKDAVYQWALQVVNTLPTAYWNVRARTTSGGGSGGGNGGSGDVGDITG